MLVGIIEVSDIYLYLLLYGPPWHGYKYFTSGERWTHTQGQNDMLSNEEIAALTDAMETIERARVAVRDVLTMFAPPPLATNKEEIAIQIATEVVRATRQGHPAGCIPHFQAVEREIAVMGAALASAALRRVTEAKKRNG